MSSPSASSALPKAYAPAAAEPEIRAKWDTANAFHADPNAPGEPYCVLIPPPNVTAALHLGHAFNNTLQDVLVRYHRMKGCKTLWMPGTDHAGISTQAIVEKRLLLHGKRRSDFTREQFIAKVQEWKDEYEATIIEQLKVMGCSCDFDRTRFTMDEVCAKAVREAFFRLFKDGLIYRGKRLVNWDPVTQTALADDEVEMEEVQGNMWYLQYPLADGGTGVPPVIVATTRPETMLGDTAVAINPKDPRAAALVGKFIKLPIVNRIIPIIADDYVVRPVQFGGDPSDAKAAVATGFLKVTPAHDPNDEAIWQRHKDEMPHGQLNIFAPDATISLDHGWSSIEPDAKNNPEIKPLVGLSREEARKRIVQWFKDHNLLEDVKPYTHSVGHSYRSHVPIEPYLSDQWYVKVTDDRMKGEALRAMASEQFEGPQIGGTGILPVQETKRGAVTDTLTIHRRNLPHWQLGGSTYFVTFRLHHGSLSDEERQLVVDACRHWHGSRLHLHIATVMPDHVHLLITPLKKDEHTWHALPDLMHSIKSHTGRELQRRRNSSGVFWQDEYFDRIVRDENEFLEKWNYIATNPVKAGLASLPEHYAFTVRPDAVDRLMKHGQDARATKHGDGELQFFPARYAKTFQQWHENLRDWCISRQLWWGHRIPVWTVRFNPAHSDSLRELNSSKRHFNECVSKLQTFLENCGIAPADIVIREVESPTEHMLMHVCCVLDPVGDISLKLLSEFLTAARNQNVKAARQVHKEFDQRFGETVYHKATEFHLLMQVPEQDPDVLDTWFSSGLWPLSTMGWPDPEAFPNEIPEGGALLNTFNPSTTLCTAREIITLWVSRMVMFNRYLTADDPDPSRRHRLPFKNVYIHAMIQDGHGQKMSKSLGNGVDPRDIIHSHGSDAMRFILTQIATATQDVRLPVDMICPHDGCGETFHPIETTISGGYRVAAAEQTCPKCRKKMVSGYGAATGIAMPTPDKPLARNSSSKFDQGRNFANKLWNATRFALSNLTATEAHGLQSVGVEKLTLVDKWIIARLHRTLHIVDDALADYQFNAYADAMYDLVWRDFCDWYLEAIKPTVKSNPAQQQVLRTVLNAILRLLHPMMPFVTETLWPHVSACGVAGLDGINLPHHDLLVKAAWPDIACSVEDKQAVATFERLQSLVDSIRTIKTERNAQKKRITLYAPSAVLNLIDSGGGVVESLAGIETVQLIPSGAGGTRPADVVPMAFEGMELLLGGLVEQVDADAERSRLSKLIAEKEKAVAGFRSRLENAGYVSKAPPEKVAETRTMLAQAEADLAAATRALQSLG